MLGIFTYTTQTPTERLNQGCLPSIADHEIEMKQQLADFDYRMQDHHKRWYSARIADDGALEITLDFLTDQKSFSKRGAIIWEEE